MKTKVTPVNYIEDLEKIIQEENVNAVGVEQMSITYIQPADTCSYQMKFKLSLLLLNVENPVVLKKQKSKKDATLILLFLKGSTGL